MFCPECQGEYRPGFVRCAACDVALVDRLPKSAAGSHPAQRLGSASFQNPVEIARFTHVHQAEFAASVLEGNGIESYVDDPFTGTIVPYVTLTAGGIRLLVRDEDQDRAREVLASAEA